MEHQINKNTNWEFNFSRIGEPDLADPYSWIRNIHEGSEARNRRKDISEVKLNKAKELAMGQIKNIFMTMISFYFIGSNLSLFTIFIFGMYGYNSLSSLLSVNNVFKPFENPQYSIIQYKLIYVCFQSISFGFILYRFYGMGLIPLNPADWIAFIENRIPANEIML
jgi:hypothetical protein